MDDRELLELAAKAVGVGWDEYENEWYGDGVGPYWNPLDSDGDAFRLAVVLGMDIFQFANHVQVYEPGGGEYKEDYNGDCCAATRRAITRAAASMVQEQS